MLKSLKITLAMICLAAPAHAVTVYSGYDQGAGDLASSPNATAAAASFDAAVTASDIVDFEGALGDFSFAGDGFVRNTQRCAPALCGYNTTAGGQNFLDVTFNTTFMFANGIDAFGAYFTGVQRGTATLTYDNGNTVELAMPSAALNDGGTTFFGFSDAGASITSISYYTGDGGDFVGVDDIRFRVAAPVPVPATLPLLLGGVFAFGLIRRKAASA